MCFGTGHKVGCWLRGRGADGQSWKMLHDVSIQRRAHVQLLERKLPQLVAQLQAMPKVEQVILFGSYAAGRRDPVHRPGSHHRDGFILPGDIPAQVYNRMAAGFALMLAEAVVTYRVGCPLVMRSESDSSTRGPVVPGVTRSGVCREIPGAGML